MFERYTEDARRALFFARYEASQLGSVRIAPEHLLLGLLRLGPNPASPFLARAGDIRDAIVQEAGRNPSLPTSVEIPFDEPTRRVLYTAAAEADRLAHAHIGAEHLLLGLLADATTIAGATLMRNGLEADAVRTELAAQPAAGRPGPLSFAAPDSPQRRRQAAVQQLDAAVAFMRNFAEQHAESDEARRAVDDICQAIAALKPLLPDA